MEYVPLFFIDAVAATVKHNHFSCPESHHWEKAFKKECANQVTYNIYLYDFKDDERCGYSLFRSGCRSTLDECRSMGSENLRIDLIDFRGRGEADEYTSLADLEDFIRFTLPSLNNTTLRLGAHSPNLNRLRSLYKDSPAVTKLEISDAKKFYPVDEHFLKSRLKSKGFMDLNMKYDITSINKDDMYCIYLNAVFDYVASSSKVRVSQATNMNQDLLMTVLEFKPVDHIELYGKRWSSSVQDAIENYALTKPFKVIDCPDLTFFLFFFERLFHVSLESGSKTIRCQLYATIEQLSQIEKSRLVTHEEQKIEWLREDGVRVSVMYRPATYYRMMPLWEMRFHKLY